MKKFSDGQAIVFEDFNEISTDIEREMFDVFGFELMLRTENAFFSDGLTVTFANATSVSVIAGLGFFRDVTVGPEEPSLKPLYLKDARTVLMPVPDVTLNRIDLIVAKPIRVSGVTENRNFKDGVTEVVSSQSFVVQEVWDVEFDVVQGVAGVSPVAPAVPSDGLVLAQVYQTATIGIVNGAAITDQRNLIPAGSNTQISTVGFLNVPNNPSNLLSSVLSQLDIFTRRLNADRADFISQVSEPTNPTSDNLRLWVQSGDLFIKESDGTKRRVSERPTHKIVLNNNQVADEILTEFDTIRMNLYQGVRFKYHIRRTTSTVPEIIEMGEIYARFKNVGGSLEFDTTFTAQFDDCGVEFSFVEDLVSFPTEVCAQLAYKTTNLAGTGHICHLTINDFNLIEVF